MDKVNKIFVYGTLKEGGFFAKEFDTSRLSSKRATITGTMLSMGSFPGIILNGESVITGEVHEYGNFDNVLSAIDYIEGCSGAKENAEDLYHRKVIKVSTEDGEEDAWTYTINITRSEVPLYKVVTDGEWKIN